MVEFCPTRPCLRHPVDGNGMRVLGSRLNHTFLEVVMDSYTEHRKYRTSPSVRSMYDEFRRAGLRRMFWTDERAVPRNWSLIYYDPIAKQTFVCWGMGHWVSEYGL